MRAEHGAEGYKLPKCEPHPRQTESRRPNLMDAIDTGAIIMTT